MKLKSKLSKKYSGIPLFVVITLVAAMGTAAAAGGYLVYKDSTTGDVQEAITVEKKKGLGPTTGAESFYPNEKIGARNGCAKYMVINGAPVSQEVTIDIVEENSNIDEKCSWYGVSVVPSQESWESGAQANYSLGHISDGPGTAEATYSLDIGTVTYPVNSTGDEPEEDSNHWRVFVDGKLKPDVAPGELNVQIKVFRG